MVMMECRNLAVGYRGHTVLKQITAAFSAGKMYAILGPNGCGKTTLLRTLARLLPIASGEILVQGKSLTAYSSKTLAKQIAVVLTSENQLEQATGYEIVSMGRYPHTGFFGRLSAHDHALVQNYLSICQAGELADQFLQEMSDGQRQKVFLARALAQETNILLLDEPTSHLDIRHKLEILQILRQICREQNRLVITSLHEPELALKSCDYFLLAGQGCIQQQGTIDDIIGQRDVINVLYGLQQQQFDRLSNLVEFTQQQLVTVVLFGSDLHTPILMRKLQQMGIGYCLTEVADSDIAACVARSMGAVVQQEVDREILQQACLVIDYTGKVDDIKGWAPAAVAVVAGHGLTAAELETLLKRCELEIIK